MAKLLHNIKECPPKFDDKGEPLKKSLRGCGSPIPTKVCLRNYRIYVDEINTDIQSKKLKAYERGEVKRILEELSSLKEDR